MKQKKLIKWYFIIVAILLLPLPALNIIFSLINNEVNSIKLDKKTLFSTDTLEGNINYLSYKTFKLSFNKEDAIIGNDGFLFLGNKYDNILHKTNGVYRPSKNEIDVWTDKLKNLQQWYEDREIKFVIVIAPNKHSIYKEKLPRWMQYEGETITDDIVKFSQDKNINLLDLRPILKQHKNNEILYWKTDTHWNEKGASIAYETTINYLNQKYKINIEKVAYSLISGTRGGGDLANFLKINSILPNNFEKKYTYLFEKNFDICKGNINKESGLLEKCIAMKNPVMNINTQPQYMTNKSQKDNKLLYLCDSFGSTSSQLFNSSFNKIWKWHWSHINGNNLSEFVNKQKPNIVIYQIVERSLYNEKIVKSMPEITKIYNYIGDNTNLIFDISNNEYIKTNHVTFLKKGQGAVVTTTNKDPIIILNKTRSNFNKVVLSYEIDSNITTRFQLFYKKGKLSKYNIDESYTVNIKKGINKFDVLIPSEYINNNLRIDLVSDIGTYRVNKLKIFDIIDKKDSSQ